LSRRCALTFGRTLRRWPAPA